MTDEKWLDTVGRIKDDFRVLQERSEPLEGEPGTRDVIVFETPHGTIKLERVTRPVFLGERGVGGKGAGAAISLERLYDEDESMQSLHAFVKRGETWVAVDAGAFTESDRTEAS